MIENFFSIDGKLLKLAQQAEVEAQEAFAQIEENSAYNEAKVLKAFIDNRVSESHFAGSTGSVSYTHLDVYKRQTITF